MGRDSITAISASRFDRLRNPLEATISIGVSAVVASHALDLKQLLERADAALYRAKDAGRNHVVSDGAD